MERPGRLARALQDRGYAVVAAFNADAAGERMSESLRESLNGPLLRERPTHARAKDWNDQLRLQRAERQIGESSREPMSVER